MDQRQQQSHHQHAAPGAVPQVMGGAEFSRYLQTLGVRMTRQAVSQSNVIPKTEHGKVLVAEALLALKAAGRLVRLPGEEIDAPLPESAAGSLADGVGAWSAYPSETTDDGSQSLGRPRGGGGGYYEQKAETEKVIRELKEIELAKVRGELVSAAEVHDAQETIARRVGARIEQLSTLAGELTSLAVAEGESAVRAALREEVLRLRADLSRMVAQGVTDDETDDD